VSAETSLWIIGGLLAVNGSLVALVWNDSKKKMDAACKRIDTHEEKIQKIELKVSESYITKADVQSMVNAVFRRLDNIDGQIKAFDGKLDRLESKIDDVKDYTAKEIGDIKIRCARHHAN